MTARASALVALAALALATSAAGDAASDAVKIYKKELGRATVRQKTYEGKGLDRDLRGAYDTYVAPWSKQGPDAPKLVNYDFSGYAGVYERWAAQEEEKGNLALSLAAVGGEKVAERLLETLLDTLDEIVRQEQVIAKARPKSGSICDQIPGIKRFGALLHRDMIVEALGKLEDAEAIGFLTDDGWDKAAKWDRSKRSDRARVAILDGLALSGADGAEAKLDEAAASELPRLRIAGLQGLAHAVKDRKAIRERLAKVEAEDACFAVRRAAADLVAVLDRKPEGEGEDAPEEPWKGLALAGIPVRSSRIVFLIDASSRMVIPADVELAKEKTWREWRAVAEKDRDYRTQFDFLRSEVRSVVTALPEGARFDILSLNASSSVTPFSPRGPLEASKGVKAKAEAFLEGILVGGWAPQINGLWEAYRIAGAEPWSAETPDETAAEEFFLLGNGVPQGGPFLYGPAIVDDVARIHRFRRIPIHTVRTGDWDEPAEEVMKGIAEVTGGRYVWIQKP